MQHMYVISNPYLCSATCL